MEIRRCPFCGSKAETEKRSRGWITRCNRRFLPNDANALCSVNARTHHHETEEAAILEWNTRAVDQLFVNDRVMVKLNDQGRKIHAENHKTLRLKFGSAVPPYEPPREDTDGWSSWQLWELMQEFGPFMRMGWPPPFEDGIRVKR